MFPAVEFKKYDQIKSKTEFRPKINCILIWTLHESLKYNQVTVWPQWCYQIYRQHATFQVNFMGHFLWGTLKKRYKLTKAWLYGKRNKIPNKIKYMLGGREKSKTMYHAYTLRFIVWIQTWNDYLPKSLFQTTDLFSRNDK